MRATVKRITEEGNPLEGEVVWSPVKSLWFLFHLLVAIVGGFFTFSIENLIFFLIVTAITLCLGHSLGMHRKLIHNSFESPLWLEYFLVHLGVVVGIAGPKGMIFQHDLRDWAQRKDSCHSYLRHGEKFLKDFWWQVHCDLALSKPPVIQYEEKVEKGKVYRFMEKYWYLQQLPWILLFYYLGGVGFVIWGISARIAISIFGHWIIGYFAHNQGKKEWHVMGAAVQGHNVPFTSLITMGESLHNNHHAFPGSAKLSMQPNELDPGWWVLKLLSFLGLVWGIKTQHDLEPREELVRVATV